MVKSMRPLAAMTPTESSMRHLLLVGLGGALGAMARHALGAWLQRLTAPVASGFPVSILLINVLGCLGAGAIAGLAMRGAAISADTRLFLLVGVLGGFTTFSAFGLELVALLRRGETAAAGLYAGGSVVLGVAAVLIGWRLTAAWAT